MSLTRWIILALLSLPLVELLVFGLVAAWIGFLNAVGLGLAASLVGFLLLRHAGTSGMAEFRVAMADGSAATRVQRGAQLHLVVAGFLLFIPGFITDFLGLLLLLPPVHQGIAATFGRAMERQTGAAHGASDRPSVVDLDPDQWHQVEDRRVEILGPDNEPRKPRIQ